MEVFVAWYPNSRLKVEALEQAADLVGDGGALVLLEVGDHDARAECGQLAGGGFADARGATGDDGGGSFEVETRHGYQAPIRSMMVALAMPPPSHIVCRP